MSDLSIVANPLSSNYRDLLIVNGDLVLTSDADPAGTNNVLQNILQRLRFFLGEWFLDNTQGTPWFQQILIKGPTKAVVDGIIQQRIAGTPGVLSITKYSSTFNSGNRIISVSFSALTTSGMVSYSGSTTQPGGI